MKSNLAKSHDAMLAFLEKLIVNSDKFPSRRPAAQRHYDQAIPFRELLILLARSVRMSSQHQSNEAG